MNDEKYEILVEVDLKQVAQRFEALQKSDPNCTIVPVVKNNCNGLEFEHILELYYKIGVKMVACSYANEFYLKAKEHPMRKLAWNWFPDKKYTEVTNLELCCKNIEQLKFCIENNIPYHIVFNLVMNRGGFKEKDITDLYDFIVNQNKKSCVISIAMHCPWEDEERVNKYLEMVERTKEACEKAGFEVGNLHCANGELFRDYPKSHYTMARIGTPLLLPQNDRFSENYNPINISTYVMSGIMHLYKGENIGYDALTLDRDIDAIVIPVGYYNFEVLNKVAIRCSDRIYRKFNVLNMMHDTAIVDITGYADKIKPGDKVDLFNIELYKDNWNYGMARTFKLNKDLCKYIFNNNIN